MTTELPPNLDDGELWLPADIIPEVGYRRQISGGVADIRALAGQLTALGLLEPRPTPARPAPPAAKPPPFPGEVPQGLVAPGGFGYGYDTYRVPVGTGAYLRGPEAAAQRQKIGAPKPKAQAVDSFGQRRMMGQQQPPPQLQEQSPAIRGHYFPFGVHGPGRTCGGTGVFLPRVAAMSRNRTNKPNTSTGEKRGQPTRSSAAAAAGTKQIPVHIQRMPLEKPPTEICLPQEWTY